MSARARISVWVLQCHVCVENSISIFQVAYRNRSTDCLSLCRFLLSPFAVSLANASRAGKRFFPSPSQSHTFVELLRFLKYHFPSSPSLCHWSWRENWHRLNLSLSLLHSLPPAKEEMRCALQQSFYPSHLPLPASLSHSSSLLVMVCYFFWMRSFLCLLVAC